MKTCGIRDYTSKEFKDYYNQYNIIHEVKALYNLKNNDIA